MRGVTAIGDKWTIGVLCDAPAPDVRELMSTCASKLSEPVSRLAFHR